jgi:SAM-dependent methyltransferase
MSDDSFDPADPAHVALWDELPMWSALAGQLLLEHVPMDATRVIDLGCGTGFPGLELAERLGPAAWAVGVDPWRTALERARAKARAWPVANFLPVIADGARLPLRDGSADLVVSNLGVNNFADPEGTYAEIRRVLARGGRLAIATNVVGHFRELYGVLAEVLGREGDAVALERLRTHVRHRATVASLTEALARHDLRVTATHERETMWRFRDGTAMFAHHFIRMGFTPGWREVAGERADALLDEVRATLDARARIAGELRLAVPLAVLVARAG